MLVELSLAMTVNVTWFHPFPWQYMQVWAIICHRSTNTTVHIGLLKLFENAREWNESHCCNPECFTWELPVAITEHSLHRGVNHSGWLRHWMRMRQSMKAPSSPSLVVLEVHRGICTHFKRQLQGINVIGMPYLKKIFISHSFCFHSMTSICWLLTNSPFFVCISVHHMLPL